MVGSNIWAITAAVFGIGFIYIKYFRAQYCRSKAKLTGKTVIVTGGNAGIGKTTAIDLARRGARVILACRNPLKAGPAVKEIRERSGSQNVVFRQLDMASPDSIRSFAKRFLEEESRLDVLINNAGIADGIPGVTVEGHDLIMWVNHYGPFLLTHLLLNKLKESAPSRIITVSSSMHSAVKNQDEFFYIRQKNAEPGTRTVKIYGQTKTANILFMRELAKRLEGTGVTTCSLHPGYVQTNALQSGMENAGSAFTRWKLQASIVVLWPFLMPPEAGAQTTIYCAVDESVPSLSGRYFTGCQVAKESNLARDDAFAKNFMNTV
ncbi:dehydrogenase/reductase SDR family member 13-like [Amphiura filiformis]|uniref:dehydrogenase/reductase SDR family member 13-like n=1 Tax=Amphiura filiformis TaxID=82378 RepID=UPI003B21A0AC